MLTTFQLQTLTCPSCVIKIEKALSSLNGASNVEVLFNASKVKVEIDEQQTSSQGIKQVIENLGYEVLSVK